MAKETIHRLDAIGELRRAAQNAIHAATKRGYDVPEPFEQRAVEQGLKTLEKYYILDDC